MEKDTLFDQLENLELSNEELEKLTYDDGQPLNLGESKARQLERKEREISPDDYRRIKNLTTGHKLRIVADLKSGKTQSDICRAHKLSPTGLALILNDDALQEVTSTADMNQTKKIMASRFYHIADMALSHIDTVKLQKLDPYRLVMLSAIAVDKARLLDGQSTENITFRNLSLTVHAQLEQLQERKQILLEVMEGKAA